MSVYLLYLHGNILYLYNSQYYGSIAMSAMSISFEHVEHENME